MVHSQSQHHHDAFPSRSQYVADDSVELETYLGVLARNNQLAPLTFKDWRVVPSNLKELMWSEIETMKSGGLVPSRAEIFRITHTTKNQQPVDLRSAKVMVLGEDRHGYVRTFALGPSPSDIFGPQPTRMEYKRIAEQAIRSSDERVHAMEERMLGMQKTIEDMAMQMRSMRMAMENMPGG
ncbi:hypothetical protein Salat_1740700 [Sesamum alatum]|uniref:Uncharacterized protein n=1 Tax=Sesamum alatum TaxID=300844 RepID=A0AAE1Y8I6_9LAMI|nr:hypothetical protein Salat_1740700 [Sesamum alatum]